MGMEFWWFFNCRKDCPVNRLSEITLRGFELGETGTVSGSCKSQLALFTAEHRGRFAAGGGTFQNMLKARVFLNCSQFHEGKLNLCFKFIGYYACLLSKA